MPLSRRAKAFAAAILLTLLPAMALASSTPPSVTTRDPLGVDLGTGEILYAKELVRIGAPGTHQLSATFSNVPGTDENTGAIAYTGDAFMGAMSYKVSIGYDVEIFTGAPGSFVSTSATGSTLVYNSASNTYTYTKRDGTVAIYDKSMANQLQIPSDQGVLTSVTFPSNEKLTYYYKTLSGAFGPYVRLRSVVSSRGLMLKYTGLSDTPGGLAVTAVNTNIDYCDPYADSCTGTPHTWPKGTMNNPTSTTTHAGPTAPNSLSTDYYTITRTVTNPAGKISSKTYNQTVINYGAATPYGGNLSYDTQQNYALIDEAGIAENVSYYDLWTQTYVTWGGSDGGSGADEYGTIDSEQDDSGVTGPPLSSGDFSDGRISSVSLGNSFARNYSFTGSGLTHAWLAGAGAYSSGTNGANQSFAMHLASQYVGVVSPVSRTVNGKTTTYDRDTYDRITKVTYPEGNYDTYTYDSRGNVTQVVHTPKSGMGSATTEHADYPAACAHPASCNEPTAVYDAKNNRTDFTYNDTTGFVLTETDPADSSGQRLTTTYSYMSVYAQVKASASAAPGNAATPVTVLASKSRCMLHTTCTTTSSEYQLTTYGYDANLNLASVTQSVGDNSVSAVTVTTTYDAMGNPTVVDGPLTADDKTYKTYDVMRRVVYEIGVDPDGTGPLKRAVVHHVYDDAGKETQTETGVGQAIDGSDFSRKSYVVNTYNNSGLIVQTASYIDGNATPQSLKQVSYDTSGRVVCSAIRMTLTGSQPASPCTATTSGPYGPDRVTQTVYNPASQVTEIDQGVGTTDQRIYARYTYTNNGLKSTESDANSNQTEYTYDGFDRLSYIYYPQVAIGAGAFNTNDFENFGYDVNGNKTSWRRRDNNTINFTYDNLNRQIVKDLPVTPDNANGTDKDVFTAYDLTGNVTSRRFSSATTTAPGTTVTYAYDGLGRLSYTIDANGRMLSYLYNQASQRTRLIFPDAHYIGYTLDNANRVVGMGWDADTGLVTPAYDDLGRMVSLARQATSSTIYGYDNLGRLTSQFNNMAGTSSDITWGFQYNPAGQLYAVSSSNNNYVYTEPTNLVQSFPRSYDGLNRDAGYVSPSKACGLSGTTGPGFDARGNLICDGVRKFTYDIENRLLTKSPISAIPDLTLTYDPEGRLSSTKAGSVTTQFLYDGVNLIGEYDVTSGSMTARYADGAGTDDPLVWFTDATNTNTRYFYYDYHGTVIGYAGSNGSLAQLYKYDAYGVPKNSSNVDNWSLGSRFRYTGQLMIPEAKLYYYKARVYDPVMGRFLQTDPIGSKDDLDLYGYTAGDPVNRNDATGLLAKPEDAAAREAAKKAWIAAQQRLAERAAEKAAATKAAETVGGTVIKGVDLPLTVVVGLADPTSLASKDQDEPRVQIYRAISAAEYKHLMATGNYGFSPSGGGKYFALSLAGAQNVASKPVMDAPYVTRTSILPSVAGTADRIPDPGLAGPSLHFSDPKLPSVYATMTPVEVISGPDKP